MKMFSRKLLIKAIILLYASLKNKNKKTPFPSLFSYLE